MSTVKCTLCGSNDVEKKSTIIQTPLLNTKPVEIVSYEERYCVCTMCGFEFVTTGQSLENLLAMKDSGVLVKPKNDVTINNKEIFLRVFSKWLDKMDLNDTLLIESLNKMNKYVGWCDIEKCLALVDKYTLDDGLDMFEQFMGNKTTDMDERTTMLYLFAVVCELVGMSLYAEPISEF